jgi:hypothetical protein
MLSLEEVVESFEAWRASRSSRKEKIPTILWDKVARIYSSYNHSTLCRALKISGSQLKAGMHIDSFAVIEPPLMTSIFEQNSKKEASSCEVSIERAGTRLTIKLPADICFSMVQQLAGYLP